MQGESRVQDSNTTTRYETSFPGGLKPFLPPCETLSTKIKHGCWAPPKRHHLQQLCRIVSLFARNMTLMCMGIAAAENSCFKTDSCIKVLECGYSFFFLSLWVSAFTNINFLKPWIICMNSAIVQNSAIYRQSGVAARGPGTSLPARCILCSDWLRRGTAHESCPGVLANLRRLGVESRDRDFRMVFVRGGSPLYES
jgi:hypothetical protein